MSDINSLITNYLQKTGKEENYEDVTKRIKDLAESITDKTSGSIFDYGTDGATEDELLSFMSDVTGKNSDDIADDVALLFDILNSESEDNVLTDDEMSMLNSKADGGISGWGIYNNLVSNTSADEVNEQLNAASASQGDDIDLNDYYNELSSAGSKEERDKAYADIMEQIKSQGLSGSDLSDCLNQVIESIKTSQASELDDLKEKLSEAATPDERELIAAEINKKSSEFNSELNQYEIKYNQSSSNLTEGQSDEMITLYEDLANAKSQYERDAIIAQIGQKQEEYNMSDSELALSHTQIINSTYASYSNTLADLYEQLSETSDNTEKENIKSQISQLNAGYNQEINRYEIAYNQSTSMLTENQSDTLTELYNKLSNAVSQNERDEIIAQIEEKQQEYTMNDSELSLSNNQIVNSTLASYSGEIADLYEKLSETEGEDARNTVKQEITEKLSEYNEYYESHIEENNDISTE